MGKLERLESFTSRFVRLSDLLIQRIFCLVDEIKLTRGGSILDRIYRTERTWFGTCCGHDQDSRVKKPDRP